MGMEWLTYFRKLLLLNIVIILASVDTQLDESYG